MRVNVGAKMDASIQWRRPLNALAYEKAGGDRGQLFLANEAKRLMDPYVPANNLILAQNVRTYVEDGAGIVEYQSPYAHYQYEGEVYGPNYPIYENGEIAGWYSPGHKQATGKSIHYSTFRHPLATDHWDKAMMTARKGDLARAYERYLKGKT